MKHRAFTYVEFAVVIAMLVVLPATYFLFFVGGHPTSKRASCQSNLKQIGLGFLQYAQDYNEKFPDVAASRRWPVALQPYTKDWRIFHCPSANSKRTEQTTDYFINARAANLKLEKFENISVSILSGDGLSAQTGNAVLSSLPASWISDSHSPAYRHLVSKNSVGAVYLFADGHTKWLEPEQITLDKPSAGKPTFLVK